MAKNPDITMKPIHFGRPIGLGENKHDFSIIDECLIPNAIRLGMGVMDSFYHCYTEWKEETTLTIRPANDKLKEEIGSMTFTGDNAKQLYEDISEAYYRAIERLKEKENL